MVIERITPDTKEWTQFYGNHINRYIFAKKILEKNSCKNILDIACGVGYGTKFLSDIRESEIIGVDRSSEAINTANTKFKAANNTFVIDDCIKPVNLGNYKNFDGIVSFETLEHLKEAPQFLKNLFDKLRTGGTLIISTPNKMVTSPDGIVRWDYHEMEYNGEEFNNMLLNAGFNDVKLFGQEFSDIGKLRSDIKMAVDSITTNPFFRLGRFLQKLWRKKLIEFIIPEDINDFNIVPYTAAEIINKSLNGPFVLIAVCTKN